MNKFSKRLLVSMAAIGLMVPIATNSLSQAHASRYSYGLGHNLVIHAINNGYVYGPTKRFNLIYKHNRFTIVSNRRHGGGTIVALNGNYHVSRNQITSALKGRRVRTARRNRIYRHKHARRSYRRHKRAHKLTEQELEDQSDPVYLMQQGYKGKFYTSSPMAKSVRKYFHSNRMYRFGWVSAWSGYYIFKKYYRNKNFKHGYMDEISANDYTNEPPEFSKNEKKDVEFSWKQGVDNGSWSNKAEYDNTKRAMYRFDHGISVDE